MISITKITNDPMTQLLLSENVVAGENRRSTIQTMFVGFKATIIRIIDKIVIEGGKMIMLIEEKATIQTMVIEEKATILTMVIEEKATIRTDIDNRNRRLSSIHLDDESGLLKNEEDIIIHRDRIIDTVGMTINITVVTTVATIDTTKVVNGFTNPDQIRMRQEIVIAIAIVIHEKIFLPLSLVET
jgi:hypothetical protein